MQAQGGYSYSSEPRSVNPKRKYRDEEGVGNMMHDRRIVRGNTYAAAAVPGSGQPDGAVMHSEADSQNRSMMRRQQYQQHAPSTPEAIDGRKHIDVQTEQYLEELADRPIEVDIDTQTDAFLDRPASPIFIPMKIGVDAETQIYEGDLFDFDYEVEPILEVLTGKTLEQSMLEVMEEEELANMRRHQEEFERLRNAELAEVQRLEAAERRRFEEKQRRMQQERSRLAREKQVRGKVAAKNFAKEFLMGLGTSVFGGLEEGGFFYDPLIKDVEDNFMPWLVDRVQEKVEKVSASRAVTEHLVTRAVQTNVARHTFVISEVQKEKEVSIQAELKEWREKAILELEERRLKELAEAEAAAAALAEAEAEAEAAALEEEGEEEEGEEGGGD